MLQEYFCMSKDSTYNMQKVAITINDTFKVKEIKNVKQVFAQLLNATNYGIY